MTTFSDRAARSTSARASLSLPFAEAYVKSMGITHLDPNYDEMLIAMSRIGGKLKPLELERLTHLGYAGDYRSQLREALGD